MGRARWWTWLAASCLLSLSTDALADAIEDLPARQFLPRAHSVRAPLRVSGSSLPDTVWFGHSYTNHWSATNNFWNLYTGDYKPGTANANNAFWDWDHMTGFGPGSSSNLNDSLCGWWPVRRPYNLTGGLTLPDASRPWWALDHGNVTNYRINGSASRTKGIVGAWHHDAGASAGGGVQWTPLGGSKSAWCGLRQHGDVAVVDPITGNPYNATTMELGGAAPSTSAQTRKNLPGYLNQWDQLLYRDVSIAAGTPLTVSFRYRTRLSTFVDVASATRTGWFHGDPLAVTGGNFISSTAAGASAPRDSFSVYLGVPVNDAACTYSDGIVRPVYDPLRRWFSEVIRVFGPGNVHHELFATAGDAPTDTLAATPTFAVTIPAEMVDGLLAAQGGGASGRARLVFRVKTNRDQSDEDGSTSGYSSRSRGAALVDDVTVNGVVIGDFEGDETAGVAGTPDANAPVDNAPTTSAAQNWKSTGKPPAIHWHPRSAAELRYDDLCGPLDSPTRQCNLSGVVISAGNFDDDESAGDRRFAAERERLDGMLSPTIDMVTAGPGSPSTPNPMGLSYELTHVWWTGEDLYLQYDLYAGIFDLAFTGNAWTFGAQSYPSLQANGGRTWGEIIPSSVQLFEPNRQCLTDAQGLFQNGVIRSANGAGNPPDSLRVFLGKNQQCFRFGVSTTCGPTDGAYFDNVSLAFVNYFAASSQAALAVDIWQWFQDAFPANETIGLPGTAAFDTTTAWIKSGINNAQSVTGSNRYDVAGDSMIVFSQIGATARRIDLVFRVLPGPGNYQVAGGRTFDYVEPGTGPVGTLLQLPTNQVATVTPGDGSFWGQYISNPGEFSAGTHNGGTSWDHLTWNSARCDTAERNVFPVAGKIGTNRGGASGLNNQWMSTYHESDPKFTTLGYDKFKCFVVDTALTANQLNIICNGTVPAWVTTVPATRTGYDGSNVTKEFTKIIPDGLLTPGSHVQYFYRYSSISQPANGSLVPDTMEVWYQPGESSLDKHRWQQFSVLPDRWKDPVFGGMGMACMLVVDQADRRGEEGVFISIADSIGLTSLLKRGAHNGWMAPGGPNSPLYEFWLHDSLRVQKNAQAGTGFDLYNVKAGESPTTSAGHLGSRYSLRTPGTLLDGKWNRSGPTTGMLRAYYRMIVLLSGTLHGVLGPQTNASADDIGVLTDFLTAAAGTARPRGLWVFGGNFVEGETRAGQVFAQHADFLDQMLGVRLEGTSLRSSSSFTGGTVDLFAASEINPNGTIVGHNTSCLVGDDVLGPSSATSESRVVVEYGVLPRLGAAVLKPSVPGREWIAMTEGTTLRDVVSRDGTGSLGRLAHAADVLATAFAGVSCSAGGGLLDAPGQSAARYRDALALFGNPLRTSFSRFRLSLSAPDRVVVKLHDVSGRVVRTLADRTFTTGEHDLRWDGTDDGGRRLPRGVYFAQARYLGRGVSDARKVMLVK